jgi:hypothetical protein
MVPLTQTCVDAVPVGGARDCSHIAAIDVAVHIRDDGPVYVRVMFRESELRLRASSKRSRLGSLYEKYKIELSERPAGDSSSEVV